MRAIPHRYSPITLKFIESLQVDQISLLCPGTATVGIKEMRELFSSLLIQGLAPVHQETTF